MSIPGNATLTDQPTAPQGRDTGHMTARPQIEQSNQLSLPQPDGKKHK